MRDGLDALHDRQQLLLLVFKQSVLLPQLGAKLCLVRWFHDGQSVLLRYDSGTKRRPGISKNVVFIRAVESQVIRDCNSTSRNQNQSQIQTIIKTV